MSPELGAKRALILLGTWLQVSRRFPILKTFFLEYLFPRMGLAKEIGRLVMNVQMQVRKRIENRSQSGRHPDLMDAVIPASEDKTGPSEQWLVAQAAALTSGGFGPVTGALTSSLYFLCSSPEKKRRLTKEIRGNFGSPYEITADSLRTSCPYLNAVIQEDLRLHTPAAFGLPRFSPGATVDGHFVPAGVSAL